MNRRRLLQGLSFSMLAAKLSGTSTLYGQTEEAQAQPMRTLSANDRIQVGFIGPGSRGQELIRQLLRTPGVDIAAQCDVYEPRFAEVNELVGKNVPLIRIIASYSTAKIWTSSISQPRPCFMLRTLSQR